MDGADLAAYVVPAIEDAHAFCAVLQSAAQRVGWSEAYEKDEVFFAFYADFQVVEDSAEFAGGAAGDDDARACLAVDFSAVVGAAGEGDVGEAKEIFRADHGGSLCVVVFAELGVGFSGLHAHGAIDKDGDLRHLSAGDELLHVPEDGLCAADGEGGNQQAASVVDALFHGGKQLRADFAHWGMFGVPVGAFGDDQIDRRGEQFGIADDGRVVAANVGGKEKSSRFARFGPFENDVRRAHDVAGVVKGESDAVTKLGALAVLNVFECLNDRRNICGSIKRVDLLGAGGALSLIQIARIFFLNLSRIHEHDAGDGSSTGRAIDRAFVARAEEDGKLAAMIEMAMRKDHRIDGFCIIRKQLVQSQGHVACALIHADIEKDSQTVHFNEMTGSGNGSICTAELNSHGGSVQRSERGGKILIY